MGAEEGIVAALEAANKLASSDAAEVADEEEDEAKEELVGSQNYKVIKYLVPVEKLTGVFCLCRQSLLLLKSQRSPL